MNSVGSVGSVGSNSGATSPTTVLAGLERPSSRGSVLQRQAIFSSPPSVDMRGDLPVAASFTADANDDKRNVIRHLAIVSAAIEADPTASAAHKEVSTGYQSYQESLDAELYMSLGVAAAQVVESSDLATIFASYARTTTDKKNPELAKWAALNSTLKQSTNARLGTLKREYDANLVAQERQNAPKRPRVFLARNGHSARSLGF